MNSFIIPAITYGAQSWTVNNKMKIKLITTQNSMMRSMLEVTNKFCL